MLAEDKSSKTQRETSVIARRKFLANLSLRSPECISGNEDYARFTPANEINPGQKRYRYAYLSEIDVEKLKCFSVVSPDYTASEISRPLLRLLQNYDKLLSEASEADNEQARVWLTNYAVRINPYGSEASFLDQVTLELFAPEKLFRGAHGLSSCGQTNCRFLHRVCGTALAGDFDELTLIQGLKDLCLLRKRIGSSLGTRKAQQR